MTELDENITEKTIGEDINETDNFDYSTQCSEYNARFSKWRQNKQNPYTYSYSYNSKESVFIESKGFVHTNPAEVENVRLSKLVSLIGIVLLIALGVENIFKKFFINILGFFGVNIYETFYKSIVVGGRREITAVLIFVAFLKLLIPLIVMRAQLKMPNALAYPSKLKNSGELVLAIAVAVIASVVTLIPNAFSEDSKEMFYFLRSYDTDGSVLGHTEFIVFTIFDVIFVSILFECLFRGRMFIALRQYGDVYAMVISSVASAIFMPDISSMLSIFIVSIAASIAMLRCGTIYAPVMVHVIYKVFGLGINLLETDTSDRMLMIRNAIMAIAFLAAVLILLIAHNINELGSAKTFARYTSDIPLKVKLLSSFKIISFTGALVIALVAAAMNFII